jgi:hypothetical protein
MKVLDLFSGLGGWSQPAIDAGDEVCRVELETHLPADIYADVRDVHAADLPWVPDLILASPPCEAFSVMNIGKNWYHDGTPKTDKARLGIELVEAARRIIAECGSPLWLIENPRDKLRVLPVMAGVGRRTVTYCQYGEKRMKPTDLFSDHWPEGLVLAEPCRNGDPCHVRAPRGSTTGTQGSFGGNYWEKSRIPYPLAKVVTDAARESVERG